MTGMLSGSAFPLDSTFPLELGCAGPMQDALSEDESQVPFSNENTSYHDCFEGLACPGLCQQVQGWAAKEAVVFMPYTIASKQPH